MSRMLEDYALDCEILGAYEAYEEMCATKEEAIERTCKRFPIAPVELENLIKEWEELVASGRVVV